MSIAPLQFLRHALTKVSLQWVLIVPFMAQILGTVGVVGYLSYQSGQQAVEDLAHQLMKETGNRVEQNLDQYLATLNVITQTNRALLRQKRLNGYDLGMMEQHFIQQMQIFPNLSAVAIANETREFLSVERPQSDALTIRSLDAASPDRSFNRYRADQNGQNRTLQEVRHNYDPHNDPPGNPWYRQASTAQQGIWTLAITLAKGPKQPILQIVRFLPFYGTDGLFQGVLASSVYLTQLGDFLQSLNPGTTGEVFLMERDGMLIATSTGEVPFDSRASAVHAQNVAVQHRRLKVTDSTNPLTRSVAQQLKAQQDFRAIHDPQLLSIVLAGKRYFVQVRPLSGDLDWLMVIVRPEADFMDEIYANLHRTAILCGLALWGAILGGVWMTKRLTRSLLQLTQATQDFASGNLKQSLPVTRIAEVSALVEAFRQMVRNLQAADQLRRNYEQDLERQVAEKTIALTEAQRIAHVGSWEFDVATGENRWSAEQFRILGFDPSVELPKYPDILALVPQDDQPKIRAAVEGAIAHAIPYEVEHGIIRLDGSPCYVISRGEAIVNDQGQVIKLVGTITDITDRKQAELALQQSQTRFLKISDSSPAIIYILVRRVDGSLYFEHMSQAITTMHELSVEQVLEDAALLLDLIHPDDCMSYEAAVQRSLATLEPFCHEWRIINPSGTIRWLQGSSRPKQRDNGEIAWYGVAIDITDLKLVELALQQSEIKFQEFAAASPGVIFTFSINPEGVIQFESLSPAAEEIHEIPVAELLQNSLLITNQCHPDDLAGYQQAVAHCLETLEPFQYEWRIITPSGKTKWLNANARPQRRDTGESVWHGIAIDVSDRKVAEIALAEKTAFLNEAQRIAKIGSWSWNLISNERWWSPQMYQLVGLNPEAYLVPPDMEVTNQNIHPEDRERVSQVTRKAIEQGISYEIEFRFLQPDGSPRYTFSTGLVERNHEGQVTRFWGISQDITERKQVEEALRQNEERFREIAQTISQFFFVRSAATGAFIYVSPAYEQIWGRSCESLYQDPHSWLEAVHPDDRSLVMQSIAQQFAGNSVWREYRIIRPDGEIRWIFVQVNLVQNEAGELLRFIGFATDITDRKQAEQALQQAKEAAEAANQAKSTFLANMSHELRTPLNAVLGFTQLLKQDTTLSSDYQTYIKLIYTSGNHLLRLINEILDLSKIEAGKLTLENEAIDLFEVLHTLRTTLSPRANHKELQLHLEISPGVPQYINVDVQKLQQVLINLVGNAIKFTAKGNVALRVSLAEWKSQLHDLSSPIHLCFQVEDTGIGIPPQALNLIFDAFAQASAGQQYQGGTGLGLTISRRLVQLMGGEITVNSRLGQGSTFQFTIPVQVTLATNVLPDQPKQQVIGLAPNQPKYRILVVDDHAENRLLLVKLLEQLELDVQEASTGETAIQRWQHWHPHLIWMDLRMPGLDGCEVTRRIRAEEQRSKEISQADFPHCPPTIIIALTAQASIDDRTRALAAGCQDYISKPFQAEVLFSKMAEHLGIRYIYAEASQELVKSERSTLKPALTPESFAVMPQDWVIQVRQAAMACGEKALRQLIQQISPTHSSLALGLEQLIQDFEFAEILQLTEAYVDSEEVKHN